MWVFHYMYVCRARTTQYVVQVTVTIGICRHAYWVWWTELAWSLAALRLSSEESTSRHYSTVCVVSDMTMYGDGYSQTYETNRIEVHYVCTRTYHIWKWHVREYMIVMHLNEVVCLFMCSYHVCSDCSHTYSFHTVCWGQEPRPRGQNASWTWVQGPLCMSPGMFSGQSVTDHRRGTGDKGGTGDKTCAAGQANVMVHT